MLFFLSIYILGLIGFVIHVIKIPSQNRTKAKLIELFLLYQLVFSVGITSLVAFYGLTFMAEYIAKYTNWPECPFQQELGNVNLAFGVLGILCIWYRRLFWAATVIGFSVWILSDGIHHVLESIYTHNYSEGNVGVILYLDFIIPILLLILLPLYMRSSECKDNPPG